MYQTSSRRKSTHYNLALRWKSTHTHTNKQTNTKTRRFELIPFQLFPYTTPEKRDEYYDTDGEGEYSPETLRYDWVGVRNHCRDMESMRKAEAKSSDTDPT